VDARRRPRPKRAGIPMSREARMSHDAPISHPSPSTPLRKVPIAWEALEDAFENNAPEVHSYLHMETGEVIRIVDGIADPQMHQRVMKDAEYLRVEPVSSREQYRWMERFIATVEELEVRDKLVRSIDGKGAFRRFKDVLMAYPVDRERWFAFRSERLRSCMEGWLNAHGIDPVERSEWRVPTADEVRPQVEREEERRAGKRSRAAVAEAQRQRLGELVELLPARELDAAIAFLEFLRERKHVPRARAITPEEGDGEARSDGPSEEAPPSES
jgi:hypothetical protein